MGTHFANGNFSSSQSWTFQQIDVIGNLASLCSTGCLLILQVNLRMNSNRTAVSGSALRFSIERSHTRVEKQL